MIKAIYTSNMRHVENTINNKELSDLNKHLHTIVSKLGNVDEFDLMIIDRLIHEFDSSRLSNRREISLTQFVSDFPQANEHLDYAFVLKRFLRLSFTSCVNVYGLYQPYITNNFKMYIEDGPEIKHNVKMFNNLMDGFEFKLTEKDVVLTLTINMDHIKFLQRLS